MSFFERLKKGFDETTQSAALEAQYLKGKQSGYPHPPHVEEQIDVMRGIREEIPKLRQRISNLDDRERELAEAEAKAGIDFNEMVGVDMQHPQLAAIYRVYGDGKTAISTERFKLHSVLHEIRQEWKPMETDDLLEIRNRQDKANRLVSDLTWFQKKEMYQEAAERESQYSVASAELIDLIHKLRVKKETQIPNLLMRVAQAEAAFHRAAAQHAEQVEAQLRNIGPVTPIPNTFGTGSHLQQSQPPPPKPYKTAVQARGLYAFSSESPQELSFNPGDILTIVSQQGDWWTAELNGKTGLIPANYVQLI